jgi:co-chaperonin GroES (HSP10)|tara:strand:+ start:124 stop:543 length:420 start_codon:yes stop_codon:yes gene_type:complete
MQVATLGKAIPNSDWVSDEEIELKKEDLPELPGYHVLVKPVSIKQKTKGGIILPDSTKDDIAYLTTVGKVLKLGKLAYDDKAKFPLGSWCEEGDYVAYGKLIGQKFVYKGVKLLLLFDDQIIMKVDNPSSLDPTFNLSN